MTFDDFWKAYPHKVGKGQARRAFAKAIKLVSADEMLAGLTRYRKSKPDWQHWCNPATWLNGERWNDEPAQETEAPKKASYGYAPFKPSKPFRPDKPDLQVKNATPEERERALEFFATLKRSLPRN